MIEGYVGLFFASLLAATLVPLSSEAVVLGMDVSGGFEPVPLLIVASLGNTLGCVVNWLLGKFCLHWRERRWFPVKGAALDRASRWFNRYGVWLLPLSWVPVVGDPLTLVAGILGVRFRVFLPLVALGRVGRYAALLLGSDYLMR